MTRPEGKEFLSSPSYRADPPNSERTPSIGIVGLGRLGRAVIDACAEQRLAVVLSASRMQWRVDSVPDVIVDASAAPAQQRVHSYCEQNGVALVECVSDLSCQQWAVLAALARRVPVIRATNLTFGHYLHVRLLRYLASLHRCSPRSWSDPPFNAVSIWERHPTTKAHRPSATATQMAAGWEELTGVPVTDVASLRAGLPVSEHELILSLASETLSVRHTVGSYAAAAAGAVTACRWVCSQPPGLTDMYAVFSDALRRTT
jgi:4-hydroxy-tetrahydrodipicolinate reductase